MSQRQLMGNQPMIVLSEKSQRTSGKDAQNMNITAGKAVAESVRTTLGPKGMDKMLVNSDGSVLITNDGVTILKEMDIDHPAANMIIEVSETQEAEVGDGTTSAVVVAGELLDQAEELLDQGIHASTLAQGYRQAAEKAKEILEDEAIDVSADDYDTLIKIAQTAITGKSAENSKDLLAELVVDAVLAVADDDGIDTGNVSVEKVVGSSIDQSELVEGVIVDKERVDENMPFAVEDANVALFDGAIEVEETEIDVEVNVTDLDQIQQFLDQEEEQLREMVDHLVDIGADVVFVGDGIDDMAQHYLAQEDILAVRRAKRSKMKDLSKSTDADIISNIYDITGDNLGFAGSIEEKKLGSNTNILVSNCMKCKAASLILRGGTEHVVDEVERAIGDAINVVQTALTDGKVLPGGGAPEIRLAQGLRSYSTSVVGREQLAVKAFADAVDVIPRTLAENAGADPINKLVDLRSTHDDGDTTAGLDSYTGEVADMLEKGVIEPLRVKYQAIESATAAVGLVVSIDDVIAAGDLKAATSTVGSTSTPPSGSDSTTSESTAAAHSKSHNEPVSKGGNLSATAGQLGSIKRPSRESDTTQGDTQSPEPSKQEPRKDDGQGEGPSVERIEVPSEVSPGQEFPLSLRWAGSIKQIQLSLPPEIIFASGTEPDEGNVSQTRHGTTIEFNQTELVNTQRLRLPLVIDKLPDDKKESLLIRSYFSFEDGSQLKTQTDLDIIRPQINTEITRQLSIQGSNTEIGIQLENESPVITEVTIHAKRHNEEAGPSPTLIPGSIPVRLLRGFLNIGIHEWDSKSKNLEQQDGQSSKIVPIEQRSERDQNILRESVQQVRDYLKRNEIEGLDSYEESDINAVESNLGTLATEERYEVLNPYLPDIKRTYIKSKVDSHPQDCIIIDPPIDYVQIPPNISAIDLILKCRTEGGKEFNEISSTIPIEPTERARAKLIDVNIWSSSTDEGVIN